MGRGEVPAWGTATFPLSLPLLLLGPNRSQIRNENWATFRSLRRGHASAAGPTAFAGVPRDGAGARGARPGQGCPAPPALRRPWLLRRRRVQTAAPSPGKRSHPDAAPRTPPGREMRAAGDILKLWGGGEYKSDLTVPLEHNIFLPFNFFRNTSIHCRGWEQRPPLQLPLAPTHYFTVDAERRRPVISRPSTPNVETESGALRPQPAPRPASSAPPRCPRPAGARRTGAEAAAGSKRQQTEQERGCSQNGTMMKRKSPVTEGNNNQKKISGDFFFLSFLL